MKNGGRFWIDYWRAKTTAMVDTDFERAMRANLAPVDEYIDGLIAKASPQWKCVDADEFMDMVRGREPETITEHLASISEDWNFIINEQGK